MTIDDQVCLLESEGGCVGPVRYGACDGHAPKLMARMTLRSLQRRREPREGHSHEGMFWMECERRGLSHPCGGTVSEFLCDRHRTDAQALLGMALSRKLSRSATETADTSVWDQLRSVSEGASGTMPSRPWAVGDRVRVTSVEWDTPMLGTVWGINGEVPLLPGPKSSGGFVPVQYDEAMPPSCPTSPGRAAGAVVPTAEVSMERVEG